MANLRDPLLGRPPAALGLNGSGSAPLTQEEYQQEVLAHLRHMHEALHALAPHDENIIWATFPEDGGLEPLPAGTTTLDFETRNVTSPDGIRRISADVPSLKPKSLLLFTDVGASIKITPGVGVFQLGPNIRLIGVSREIKTIEVTFDLPYLLFGVFGNVIQPPDLFAMVQGQVRVSDTTFSKTRAAAVADAFTSLAWVPQWGTKTLSQALYGKATLGSGLLGQKMFIIRNIGLTAAEVRVQGGVLAAVVDTLENAGFAGYVNDTDIHTPGSGDASFVTIGSLSSAIFETSIQYGVMRFQVRIPAASGAGTATRLVCEFVGLSYGIR